ncbi:MAG TPA: PilZ domain-containing protein [Polyangia bacterium]|nr:PilZ domain-containing protein [Polyangia bacterium]
MTKRYEVRRLVGVPMEVISARSDLPVTFVTWDLSPRGAFLMSDARPRPGEQIVCAFNLDGLREFCFFGEVTRVSRGRRACDSGPGGFGVRFTDAKPFERLVIRGELRRSPPGLPSRKRDNALTRAMGWR